MQLEQEIIEWAKQKGILEKSTLVRQFDKTQEEVTEIIDAINDNNGAEFEDGIGDTIVTLVILIELAKQAKLVRGDLTIDDCVETAYNVISKRTGKMVDGFFVKDK
jgi:NTP pyrophosphatase (non-canonical NTP hydrolase)